MAKQLKFTTPETVQGPSTRLSLHIQPQQGNAIGGAVDPIGIELNLPMSDLSDALQRAINNDLKDVGSPKVPGLITFEYEQGHWVMTALETGNPDAACLFLTNALDEDGGAIDESKRGLLRPDEPLIAHMPLATPKEMTRLHVTYRYATAFARRNIFNPTIEGSLDVWLLPSGDSEPDVDPVVALTTDQISTTALEWGTRVKISWVVENGIQGKLMGPLPLGTNVLNLDDMSDFPLSEGHLHVRALKVQSFVLQALVKGGKGKPNIRVVRTLMLDVFSAKDLSILRPLPTSVLPHGKAIAHWAAWGVRSAELKIKDRSSLVVLEDTGHIQEGQGSYPFRAGKVENIPVRLILTLADNSTSENDATVYVVHWQLALEQFNKDAPLVGFAYAGHKTAGRLLLCQRNNLFLADVGSYDYDDNYEPRFKPVDSPHPLDILAITSQEDTFYILGRLKRNDAMAIYRMDLDGNFDKSRTYPRHVSTENHPTQLIPMGSRIFITQTVDSSKEERNYALFTDIDHQGEEQNYSLEYPLRHFTDWQLVGLNNRIYAFHPDKGQLVCFAKGRFQDLGSGLAPPMLAASPPNTPEFDLSKGVLVAVDPVLVLLGVGQGSHPQDLVYHPQTDEWVPCGHGLALDQTRLAVRTDSQSPRLWATVGEKIMTLTLGKDNLFARYFVKGNPDRELTQNYFDTFIFLILYNRSTASILITNHNGTQQILAPGEHVTFRRLEGFAKAYGMPIALRYTSTDVEKLPGTWIIYNNSEKNFFNPLEDFRIEPRPKMGTIMPSKPVSFKETAVLGGVDTGIQAQPGGENFIVVIGGLPTIDSAWIQTLTTPSRVKPSIAWRTLGSTGTIVTITPTLQSAKAPKPMEFGFSYSHKAKKNPAMKHHLIIRFYTSEEPKVSESPYPSLFQWEKKQGPQNGKTFFEAHFPDYIDEKGMPMFLYPNLSLVFDQLHIECTPFRVDGIHTFFGTPEKVVYEHPS